MSTKTRWLCQSGLYPDGALPASFLVVATVVLFLASFTVSAASLPNLTVTGVAADKTETPVSAYRWLVEEDKTYHVQTNPDGTANSTTFDPNWDQLNDGNPGGETLSVSFHRSYMPVVAKGCVGFADLTGFTCNEVAPALKPNTQYYVSVLPRSGYNIGGTGFKTDAAGNMPANTMVYVNATPLDTAQITVLVYKDNAPINNAPDLPTEEPGIGLGQADMSGFQVILEDGGGRYGAAAGIQSQDAFGNALGTTYQGGCDASGNADADPATNFVCRDANGDPIISGFQPLVTGPDGRLTIKNLAQGKYGVSIVPPAGANWQQTSTIEGTKIVDAWVKPGEPPYFAEFGPPGFHVDFGFIQPFNNIPAGGTTTLSGTIVNQHLSRPPDYAFYNGTCFGHTTPWIGLNDMTGGIAGNGYYAAATDGSCGFSIPNVPDGQYQLVIWDSNLDLIFAAKNITIAGGACNTANGSCDLGDVPVFQWFHRQEHRVYNDVNANGLWDAGEGAINDQALNLRWRDGSLYQGNVTDFTGAYTFDQVFPFFSWLVAEVDFARFQATGLHLLVDNGGPINPADPWSFDGALAPQDQTSPADPACADPTVCIESTTDRVELGPVLTQGFQGFIGQTNALIWGKRHYPNGENGGISGIVYYAVTRAENDPALAAAEPWEPGIPGVTVNLYDLGPDGVANTADDILLNTAVTDSWDDSLPTGCKYGDAGAPFSWSPDGTTMLPTDCYDGLRNFNQMRPAVFDGGYAFDAVCAAGLNATGGCDAGFISPMPVGNYVVQVIPPAGYEILKPEDKNVDFGNSYTPAPQLLPAACVGNPQIVPAVLSLYPDEAIAAPFAGTSRPLCDKKQVTLSTGANAAADFFLFTEVPIAAHAVGFILDDTQNEFDPNSPNFGEKYAPPFVPITIRDFTGRVIGKTMSDQYGLYNFLAPSTVTANLPQPSGMSPNMLTACMNDPGDDANNPDPNWNQQYSTFCYTLQYMPGTTTYLDTPVIPVAANAGPDQFQLDCEYPNGTPRIARADVTTNGGLGGPYVPATVIDSGNPANQGVFVAAGQSITLTSMGMITVPNPAYCNPAAGACAAGADTVNKVISRDYGFGTGGTVSLGEFGTLNCPAWSSTSVTCDIPAGNVGQVGGRELTINRNNGESSKAGITVQIGLRSGASVAVANPATGIQAAIDAANSNDLILVPPGQYNEMVIMWKPVQLQGFGEGSTIINAINIPTEKLNTWRAKVDGLIAAGSVSLVPGQETGIGTPEPVTLFTEEGAGILVLGAASGPSSFGYLTNNGPNGSMPNAGARIDGFTIRSAVTGGGIVVNGYAKQMEIANNRVANNSGFYGGGIRVGHPFLTVETANGALSYADANNDLVSVHHNQIVFNGGEGGAGGGISMCAGADGYKVTRNWVCGNFSLGEGGGIAHYGRSDGTWVPAPGNGSTPWVLQNVPLIADNTVIFNETFNQGTATSGGGIFIGGATPLTPAGLSPGAGNVEVRGNLVLGNSAGGGDGGGIRLARVNGGDVAANPSNTPKRNGNQGQNDPAPWNRVDLVNNMVANNVTGLAGGGISLKDAVAVHIIHNTVANNDSLGTAGLAFPANSPNQSAPQPGAGIASRDNSAALVAASASAGSFSAPADLVDNIVWHNRQFYFWVDTTSGCAPGDPACTSTYGLCPDPSGTLACPGGSTVVYDDLAVLGTTGTLTCGSCLLNTDPLFVSEYANGDKSSVAQPEITTVIQAPPAFDEGGNFIRPKFGPLTLIDTTTGSAYGDYHLQPTSPAIDAGLDMAVASDFDGDARPQGTAVDIGADEVVP